MRIKIFFVVVAVFFLGMANTALSSQESKTEQETKVFEKNQRAKYSFIFRFITKGIYEYPDALFKNFSTEKLQSLWFSQVDKPLGIKDPSAVKQIEVSLLEGTFENAQAWLVKFPQPLDVPHPLYAMIIKGEKWARYFTLELTFPSEETKGLDLKRPAIFCECLWENVFVHKNYGLVMELDDKENFIRLVKKAMAGEIKPAGGMRD